MTFCKEIAMICRFDAYRAASDGNCFGLVLQDRQVFVRYPELPGGGALPEMPAQDSAVWHWLAERDKRKSCFENGDGPFGTQALNRTAWFSLKVRGGVYWIHITQFLYDGWTDTPAAKRYRQECEKRLIKNLESAIQREHLDRAMSRRRARQENEKKWLEEAHREPRRTNPDCDWPASVPERPLPHIAPRSAVRGDAGSEAMCRHAGCTEKAMPGQLFCNVHGQGYSGGNK